MAKRLNDEEKIEVWLSNSPGGGEGDVGFWLASLSTGGFILVYGTTEYPQNFPYAPPVSRLWYTIWSGSSWSTPTEIDPRETTGLAVATKEQLLALLGKLRLTARIKGVELEPKRVRKSKKAVADGK